MEATSERAAPEQEVVDELAAAAEAGLRLGLERWHDNCPYCFSEAYSEGLDEAVRRLRG